MTSFFWVYLKADGTMSEAAIPAVTQALEVFIYLSILCQFLFQLLTAFALVMKFDFRFVAQRIDFDLLL